MTTLSPISDQATTTAGTQTSHWRPDDTELRAAAMTYWSQTGWPVRAVSGAVVLTLGDDLTGLVVNQHFGSDLLAILTARNIHGPALSYPGPYPSTVFITHHDQPAQWPVLLPHGTILADHTDVALPPTILPTGPVHWATPTDPAATEPFPAAALHEAATVLTQLVC